MKIAILLYFLLIVFPMVVSILSAYHKEIGNSLKKFFHIEESYRFEWNDLRAFITTINVILIMIYGLSIAWFGLAVAVVGIIKDLTTDRHINGLVMHLSNVVLNVFFLVLYYKG